MLASTQVCSSQMEKAAGIVCVQLQCLLKLFECLQRCTGEDSVPAGLDMNTILNVRHHLNQEVSRVSLHASRYIQACFPPVDQSLGGEV